MRSRAWVLALATAASGIALAAGIGLSIAFREGELRDLPALLETTASLESRVWLGLIATFVALLIIMGAAFGMLFVILEADTGSDEEGPGVSI